jgi:hypothetical protein
MKKALIIIVQLFCLVVFLSFTADAQSNCTYTVNPNSFVVPISGGDYSLDITTQAGCPWTVTPFQSTRPPSISFTSPTSGTGSGKVDFTIAPNTTPSIREGGIAVRSSDFSTRASVEIVQDVQCADPMFSPSVVNVPGEGATQLSFGWSPSSINCSYITVRSNDSWITLTGMSPEQRYTFSVAPNTGPARTGTISIIINTRVNTYQKIGTLTVNQAAGQSNCTYTLTRNYTTPLPKSGGNYSIDVNTQQGCAWTVENNTPWIVITSGSSGTGSGTISFTLQPNTSGTRGATMSVAGQSVNLLQSGGCVYTPTPASINVPSNGGQGSFTINHSEGCANFDIDYTHNPWINVVNITREGTLITFFYSVDKNLGEARTGTIKFSDPFSPPGGIFTVNQAGQTNCTYTLNPTNIDIGHNGGSRSFNVITQEGCAWTASTNQPWITITGGASGTGNGTVTFTAASNFSDQQRTGIITVNNQVFTVSQNRHCLVPTGFTISVPSSGATGSHILTTSCFYVYQSNDPWIISGGSQGGTSPITYTVQPNPGAARTGTITVRFSADESFLITINQAAGQQNCTYSINPTSIQAGAAGGDAGFNITAETGCNWTAQSNAAWITVSNTTGSGAGRINYSIQSNTGAARQGTITAGGQTFTINQDAVTAPVELIRASGRVIDASFKSIRGAIVSFTNLATGETRTTTTNQFGYFHFANIERGQPYSIAISHKRYKFTTRTVIYNTGALIPIYNPDPEP